MVMMSYWLTDKAPFNEVLLHPLVCDSEGNKMSKSRGNVIDPLEIIEGTSLDNLIKKIRDSNLSKGEQDTSVKKLKHEFPQGISECGSDALRFGLLAYMVQGSSINLNINRIISYRKFCNKIWNSFKFATDKFVFIKKFDTSLINPLSESFLNSWILCKLNKTIRQVNESFEKYTLGEATNAFYNFWLYELCDIYLEATKPLFSNGSAEEKERAALTLFICLETGVRLLHPMMPFISEELYQKLPQFDGKVQSITKANYPTPLDENNEKLTNYFLEIENLFEFVNKSAATFRSIASSVNMPPQIKPEAFVITDDKIIAEQTDLLATLGKCKSVKVVVNEDQIPKGCGIATVGSTRLYLELAAHIDVKKEL
jgi:valyl-tRNA synthetase